MSTHCIEQLQEAAIGERGFLISLRMMDGFDEDKFEALIQALEECAREWSEMDSIPKVGANVLVDLYPVMISASYLYSDSEAEIIRQKAEIVGELVRECVRVDSEAS